MAIVQVKYTFYHPAGYGWSETWFRQTDLASLKQFYPSAAALGTQRAGMLSSTVKLETISCSFLPTPKGDSYLRYANIGGALPPSGLAPNSDQGDAAWTGVLFQFRAGGEQFRKAVFARGQPDDAVEPNGQIGQGAGWPAYSTAAQSWIDYIIQGSWGWMRNVPAEPKLITDYSPYDIDPRFIQVTTSAATFPAPGDVPTFRRVRITYKGYKTEINGVWTVQVLSTNSCRIITPMSLFPPPGEGQIVLYTPTFTIASNADIQKATRRAPGRPLYRTPGRLGRRVRG